NTKFLLDIYTELTRSKRSVTDVAGAVMDLFDALLPKERVLVPLTTRLSALNNSIFKSEDTILMVAFEDALLSFATKVFAFVAESCAGDSLP
ncbi:MAG: hypothetical protein WCF95_07725, partial [bacterium]